VCTLRARVAATHLEDGKQRNQERSDDGQRSKARGRGARASGAVGVPVRVLEDERRERSAAVGRELLDHVVGNDGERAGRADLRQEVAQVGLVGAGDRVDVGRRRAVARVHRVAVVARSQVVDGRDPVLDPLDSERRAKVPVPTISFISFNSH